MVERKPESVIAEPLKLINPKCRDKVLLILLVVMGVDSHSKGRGLESRRRILDGHDIFHIDLL